MGDFYKAKVKVAKNRVIELDSMQGTSKRDVAVRAMRAAMSTFCQYVHVTHSSGSETRFHSCKIVNGELDYLTKE